VTAWVAHLLATIVRVHAFVGDVRNAAAFVDTNLRRVAHRVFFGLDAPCPIATDRVILGLAAGLAPPGGGWEWNQALMVF
jgi:adenine-specific DNA glycosylase